ncbi:hypothetical protein [uncultured Thiodictyon sp.]|uniref:lysozyme inhibitor LprI family protein n=1 Tax=uncultured Thiodictyon sp. TaxID=1846217 RepID=UPI0025D75640|nr:hypothetical protein [uncultured Thiodictyon sp.]
MIYQLIFLGRSKVLITLLLVFPLVSASHAASFDCAKAATLVESAVCSDPELSALDDTLSKAYRQALSAAAAAYEIKGSQRDWMKKRNTCKDAVCLKQAYSQRIAALTASDSSASAHADCTAQAKVASDFINDYKRYSDLPNDDGKKVTPDIWVQQNTQVTDGFKRAHKKLVGNAYQESASEEDGLDADPIFDAQDYPDQGFKVLRCDAATNYVTLKGIDPNFEPEPYEVTVKTIKTEQGWLVDGAGVINIPKDKQARRE